MLLSPYGEIIIIAFWNKKWTVDFLTPYSQNTDRTGPQIMEDMFRYRQEAIRKGLLILVPTFPLEYNTPDNTGMVVLKVLNANVGLNPF